jgi:hypothetical protein
VEDEVGVGDAEGDAAVENGPKRSAWAPSGKPYRELYVGGSRGDEGMLLPLFTVGPRTKGISQRLTRLGTGTGRQGQLQAAWKGSVLTIGCFGPEVQFEGTSSQ